jgi:hypothetical protein
MGGDDLWADAREHNATGGGEVLGLLFRALLCEIMPVEFFRS